jgi:hypothetical protein
MTLLRYVVVRTSPTTGRLRDADGSLGPVTLQGGAWVHEELGRLDPIVVVEIEATFLRWCEHRRALEALGILAAKTPHVGGKGPRL